MLKERFSFFKKIEVTVDILLATAAFYWGYPYHEFSYMLPAFLVTWISLLYFQGVYDSFRLKPVSDILLTIVAAVFLGIGIFSSGAYLFKIQDLSRLFVLYIFLAAGALTGLEKLIALFFFQHVRKQGYNFRNVLVVGTGSRAQRFIQLIHNRGEWGLRIIGLIDEDPALLGKKIKGLTVLGPLSTLPDIVHENVVDEVVFIVPRSWFHKIEQVICFCETEGIKTSVAIDVFDVKFAKARQTEIEDFLLLTFERTQIKEWELFFKGFMDLVMAGALIVLLSPIFIVIVVAIKVTSRGPVFYRQTRCGLNGRKFVLYKFRTMVENAEQLLPGLMKNNVMSGPVFKMDNDPRITPLGRFLRKFSLDELPQLWNVLRRDMSIVGPRPPLPAEVKKYDSWQRRRLSMRPGITCLWQVQGRNKITDFNEWARLDLLYIDHWSLWSDVKILFKTVPVVVVGVGAK